MTPPGGLPGDLDWHEVDALFDEALERPPEDRKAFLDERCDGRPRLRAAVEDLLASAEELEGWLEARKGELGGVMMDAISERGESQPGALSGRRLGRYRILEEIGRGGMGVVFRAARADGLFEKDVAVKVLSRDISDHAAARFVAERQILASLDHPNIAGILDAGGTEDGRPYVVMEYVDGLPITVHSDRRRLSVDERIELFLEVLDAVHYAHGEGVVHRDLKPDNVLVTEDGTVKLLDFGIAKLLDESRVPTVAPETRPGTRFLTPVYASPEQIRGARPTPASDIYQLGVLLCELLTGAWPYVWSADDDTTIEEVVCGTEPGALSRRIGAGHPLRREAAADPDPDEVAALRATDPRGLAERLQGDLDAIVRRTLEKDRKRRYPSAARLARDLRRELAGDSVEVPGRSLWTRLGLAGGVRTVAGAAVVLILAAAAFASALLDVGPFGGPADRSAVAPDRTPMLLADFEGEDPGLARAATAAFRVDLSRSPRIELTDPGTVEAALGRMRIAPDTTLGPELAREIGQREGIATVVTGSVDRIGDRYLLTARIVRPASGQILASSRVSAGDSTLLIHGLDELSADLRRQIGESVKSLESEPPLERVTTDDLGALRQYTRALRAREYEGDADQAVALLREAVARDTGFAMAHRALGVIFAGLEDRRSEAVDALSRAYRHRDRLTDRERYQTVSTYHLHVTGDLDQARVALENLLELDADEAGSLNNLGEIYRRKRAFARAESLYVEAIGVDSLAGLPYVNAAEVQIAQGAFDRAEETLALARRRLGDHQGFLWHLAQLAATRGEFERAEALLSEIRTDHSDDPYWRAEATSDLAAVLLSQGRLERATALLEEAMVANARRGAHSVRLRNALQMAWADLLLRHDTATAIRLVDRTLSETPDASLAGPSRAVLRAVEFLAWSGQPQRARELLSGFDQAVPDGQLRALEPDFRRALGAVRAAGGDHDGAIETLRDSDSGDCTFCAFPPLALAFRAAGQPDSAARAYERFLATPHWARYWGSLHPRAAAAVGDAHRFLARHYDKVGAPERAREHHRWLAATWSEADGSLARTVSDVRP